MKPKKPSFLVKLLVICVAAYAAVTLMGLQFEINEKQREIASVEEQIELTRIRNAQRQAELDAEQDESSVKSDARDELGYALPGERIFIDVSN